jgi:hypothetical protein
VNAKERGPQFAVGDKFKRYVVQTFTGIVTIKKILPSGRYRLDNGEMAGEFGGILVSKNSEYHNPVRYKKVVEGDSR